MTPPKYVPIAPITDDDDLPKALVPPAWPRPVGYANGMTARGRGIVTGRLGGWGQMGDLPPGAGAEHLVRLTWYLVDLDEYRASSRELGRVYREIIGAHYPAMAVMQVAGLLEKKARLEIEAPAIVPAKSGKPLW